MTETNKALDDGYAVSIYQALRRLQQAAEVHAKRLSRYGGMTPLQLLILQTLAVRDQLTASQLSRCVSLSAATLSRVLERLGPEADGATQRAAGFVEGWISRGAADELSRLPRRWKALRRRPAFWKGREAPS